MNQSPDRLSYWFAALAPSNDIAIAAVIDAMEERDVAHTVLLRRVDGHWKSDLLSARAIGVHWIGDSDQKCIVACQDGSICTADGDSIQCRPIGTGREMPSTLRVLTSSRVIGRHLYVAGMQRQVFRLAVGGVEWERFDETCLVPRDVPEIAGFGAIDGDSDGSIYAVGYGGEIWRHDGRRWQRCPSPTNVKLVSIRAAGSDNVLIGGGNGILICGGGERWSLIEQTVTTQTIVAIEWHRGSFFVATGQGRIYRIIGQELHRIELPDSASAHWLHSDGAWLIALGYRAAYAMDPAGQWARMPLPQLG